MTITIDQEAVRNKLLSTDEDRFRKRYKETDNLTGLEVIFSSPLLYTLEKNRFFLMKESRKIILDTKFHFRPDYLSVDEYGTETLWYILLFVNDMTCIEQFDTYEILVPSYTSILELSKYNVDSNVTILEDVEAVSEKLLALYETKVKPPTTHEEEPVPEDIHAKYWVRQKFEVDAGMETAGFLDLAYEAIENTLSFKVEHGGNFIHNVDYNVIISYDDVLRRVSWKDEDCGEGPGLMTYIKDGMMLEVQYAKFKK